MSRIEKVTTAILFCLALALVSLEAPALMGAHSHDGGRTFHIH